MGISGRRIAPFMNQDASNVAGQQTEPAARVRLRKERMREQQVPAHLHLRTLPELREPILLMAFEGWNDAGEAATSAAVVIKEQRDGQKFATIDSEEFFVYTDTRPQVRITRSGRRRLAWPSNDFYACPDPRRGPEARDLIILLGTEPDLRWREFTSTVLTVAKLAGVKLVVSLGALHSDVPHTIPPHVSRYATNAKLHPLLEQFGARPSKYEGPTGIVTALSTRFAESGYPVADLWGHAPHYIQASPNPTVAATLVREVGKVLQTDFEITQLEEEARTFDEQVREAVSKDPEAMAYVRDLERQYDEQRAEEEGIHSGGELPSGAAMVDALEEFLRKRRRPPGANPSAQ
jgi:proteasome assembly chaperone (PAC2) family protein